MVFLKTDLSDGPAKGGPLDFGTKNTFPLFFVSEKGLVQRIKKNNLLFFNSFYLVPRAFVTLVQRNRKTKYSRKMNVDKRLSR